MLTAFTERGDSDAVAATSDHSSLQRISYRQVDVESAAMAARLVAAGVGKGVRVAVLAPNGPLFLVALLAVTRIGAVAVPINTFCMPTELQWILRDADVHTLLACESVGGVDIHSRLRDVLAEMQVRDEHLHLPSLPQLRSVLPLGSRTKPWPSRWPAPVSEEMFRACQQTVRPADDFVIVYTSGSTANPKGVIHTHAAAIGHSRALGRAHEWGSADRIYVPLPFFWIGGLIVGLLAPLHCGATVITHERFCATEVLSLLERERATYALGLPHVGPALLNDPHFTDTDLSTLNIRGYLHELLPRRAGEDSDVSLLVLSLGMTETCSSHTWWPPDVPLPQEKRGSVGVSAPGFAHKIVDDDGRTVAVGDLGEICVRGRALMRGMVGRLAADVFDPDGWYHTGDFGHIDGDGHIYFAGRRDEMIRTAGANVSPVEVEACLSRLDAVRIGYVVGLPDPDRGAIVAAAVVLNEGHRATATDLIAGCKAQLASYKVPTRWVVLTSTDPLPYTSTDKIDKVRLREMISRSLHG